MKTIVYTGPIADFYQGKLKHLLMTHGFDLMKSRVEGKGARPVIVIHLEAKLAWIEYVSEEISEYNNDNTLFTCSIEDIESEIKRNEETIMDDDKYRERIIKGIENSFTVTLGTDTEKKFAWYLREVNGELMIYIHERRDPGVSYFGKSDFITAFPVETILRYMERFSRKSNFNKIIDALDKTFH